MAYIHDAGFSDYCLNAAPGLLHLRRRSGITSGLVIDLGCGSGRWARELTRTGYEVFGIDQSSAFIRLARKIATQSRFAVASLLKVKLPVCDAVTSIGECLNYSFDRKTRKRELARLFAGVHRALRPGGVFIFDMAKPERIPKNSPRQDWFQDTDWAILVETAGDKKQNVLTRQITCFRKVGRQYRRSKEIHRLQLYNAAEIVELLGQTGFHVECLTAFGRFRLPLGIVAFLARKQ